MATIDDYLDAAKVSLGITSDRELSKRLGFKAQAVCHYRCKRAWPSDQTMRTIAEVANLDPHIAVLDLCAWRTEGATRRTYQEIAARLAQTAAALLIGAVVLGMGAGTSQAQSNPDERATVCYGKSRRRGGLSSFLLKIKILTTKLGHENTPVWGLYMST